MKNKMSFKILYVSIILTVVSTLDLLHQIIPSIFIYKRQVTGYGFSSHGYILIYILIALVANYNIRKNNIKIDSLLVVDTILLIIIISSVRSLWININYFISSKSIMDVIFSNISLSFISMYLMYLLLGVFMFIIRRFVAREA